MNNKVLITGGAGYIGGCLIPVLLEEGYEVCVYDNLSFGGNPLLQYIHNPNFSFIKGDIRDLKQLQSVIPDYKHIIHLAAIVGFPACRAQPSEAHAINVDGTKNVIACCDKSYQYIYYGSTGSNYGALPEGYCDETTPLNPLSLYGITKTEAENLIMEYQNSIAYRFATAFGVSSRMRLDLLVNNLVYEASKQKYMVLYEAHFMRTFIHVRDIASSFLYAMKNIDKMNGEIYNVGTDKNNVSKLQLGQIIKNITNAEIHVADHLKDEDQRNYQVSYKKIEATGYRCLIDISSGVEELFYANALMEEKSMYRNV